MTTVVPSSINWYHSQPAGWSICGCIYAYASYNLVTVLSPSTQRLSTVLKGHHGRVQAVAFVPCTDNPHWLVSAASDGCLILWDTDTGRSLRRLHKQPKDIQAFAFCRSGRWVLFGDGRGQMWEWDLYTPGSRTAKLANFAPAGSSIDCLNSVCHEAGLVAVGTGKGHLTLFDMATGQTTALHSHDGRIHNISSIRLGPKHHQTPPIALPESRPSDLPSPPALDPPTAAPSGDIDEPQERDRFAEDTQHGRAEHRSSTDMQVPEWISGAPHGGADGKFIICRIRRQDNASATTSNITTRLQLILGFLSAPGKVVVCMPSQSKQRPVTMP
ncbi:hypothetical protein WJX73_003867 [Symbiochloris irregularis]|uniref:Uncharacterized protein n=1 Tax=Symbiochloris irregularis TaxID=706552 RepID=A0AAW1NPE3_9CHLO